MNPNLNEDDRDRMEGNISDPAFALNQVILGRHLFERVDCRNLSAVQKQIYNRQKACVILADFGFETQSAEPNPGRADIVAVHVSGEFFNVRVRPRPGFWRGHLNRRIVVFCRGEDDSSHYLYPHDTVFQKALDFSRFDATEVWTKTGKYHFPSPISGWLLALLAPYRLPSI